MCTMGILTNVGSRHEPTINSSTCGRLWSKQHRPKQPQRVWSSRGPEFAWPIGSLDPMAAPTMTPSVYRGGSHFIGKSLQPSIYAATSPKEDYCCVALAFFPVGGWHSDSSVTACVLQTLLGGGSCFSACVFSNVSTRVESLWLDGNGGSLYHLCRRRWLVRCQCQHSHAQQSHGTHHDTRRSTGMIGNWFNLWMSNYLGEMQRPDARRNWNNRGQRLVTRRHPSPQ